MDSVLQCRTCGAEGERNFSSNDLGESVCNLCGTQSFQQSRNETQDEDDAYSKGGARPKRIHRGGPKEPKKAKLKRKRQLITLDNCLHVVQRMLHIQAQALAQLVHDPELPATVKSLWFHFLRMWEVSASRPLLNVFLDYSGSPEDLQQLEDSGYETEWNLHLKSTMDFRLFAKFTYRHLLGLLYLACRSRQLGVLTSDIFFWVTTGQVPYANLLAQLPADLQASVYPVRGYFDTRKKQNTICASIVAENANYLHHHLDLKLPPFNHGVAALNLCRSFQFPDTVRLNHVRLMAEYYLHATAEVVDELQMAHRYVRCEIDFVGVMVAAIKMTRGWNVWQYNQSHHPIRASHPSQTPMSPTTRASRTLVTLSTHVSTTARGESGALVTCFPDDPTPILRHQIPAFVDMCQRSLSTKSKLPVVLESHREALDRVSRDMANVETTYGVHPVVAFAPHYDGGRPQPTTGRWVQDGGSSDRVDGRTDGTEDDGTYFYPIYYHSMRNSGLAAWHGPLEFVVDMLSQYVDVPPGVVRESAEQVDRTISNRHFRS
ncbi:hypothetical protein DYB32_000328 [Aphanomyces invadans]|uniref:Rrn7/TAF1B N-terminal cyclin domain-containing protein n=1 Tax=Aphanomyces invadans TaxID=157072 RepID=A0A3R6VID3_9STRA|nr:hypothetical protein DYB32_000328 [Aphanomyces invadans]